MSPPISPGRTASAASPPSPTSPRASWPRRGTRPGDISIVNDPCLGGTHLVDARLAMPLRRDGAIVAWLSNTGHWPNTGGMVPGRLSAGAIGAEQKGLRPPPVRRVRCGVMDREIRQVICTNIRVADQRIGDGTVRGAIAAMRGRAADGMRAMLRLTPEEGTCRAATIVDSDGMVKNR
jgi:N-methylhydantoinase B